MGKIVLRSPFDVPLPDADVAERFLQMLHRLHASPDDWTVIDLWLDSVASDGSSAGRNAANVHRVNIAKLRWYCDNVAGRPPSSWHAQDVRNLKSFLDRFPEAALCARIAPAFDGDYRKRYVKEGEPGFTPFRAAPTAEAVAKMLRSVRAMFNMMQRTGCWTVEAATGMSFHGAPREGPDSAGLD